MDKLITVQIVAKIQQGRGENKPGNNNGPLAAKTSNKMLTCYHKLLQKEK